MATVKKTVSTKKPAPLTLTSASTDAQLEKRVFDFDGGYLLSRLDKIEDNLSNGIHVHNANSISKFDGIEDRFNKIDTKLERIEQALKDKMSFTSKGMLFMMFALFSFVIMMLVRSS